MSTETATADYACRHCGCDLHAGCSHDCDCVPIRVPDWRDLWDDPRQRDGEQVLYGWFHLDETESGHTSIQAPITADEFCYQCRRTVHALLHEQWRASYTADEPIHDEQHEARKALEEGEK